MIRDLYSDSHEQELKRSTPDATSLEPVAGASKLNKPKSAGTPEPSSGFSFDPQPIDQDVDIDSQPSKAPTQQPQQQPATFADATAQALAKKLRIAPEVAAKMLEQPGFAEQVAETKKAEQPKPKPTPEPEPEPEPEQPAQQQGPPQPPEPPEPEPELIAPPIETGLSANESAWRQDAIDRGKRLAGQDQWLEDHLMAAGAFDATPEQISQFAEMLGLRGAKMIDTADGLRAAVHGQGMQKALRAILERSGYAPEPRKSAMRRFGEGLVEGFGNAKGIQLGQRAAKGARDTLLDTVLGRRRFQADSYAAATEEKAKTWETMTPLERAMYDDEDDYKSQQTYGKKEVDRLQADKKPEKSGIVMPSKEIGNEEAEEGDQLGLFEGTGKKTTKQNKFKLENEKEKAKQGLMFDRMNDHPDQQSLFSTFGEAVARYQADLKKK